MNTQTHLLVAAAVLARPGTPKRNAAVIAGALLPDLSIYALFAWSRLAAIPQREVWDVIYWSPHWQTAGAVSNSFPLWGLLALSGWAALRTPQDVGYWRRTAIFAPLILFSIWMARRIENGGLSLLPIVFAIPAFLGAETPRSRVACTLLLALALAALLHLALDFPVHAGDAHRHFWPLAEWRFQSPLSYWNPEHHGRWVSVAEALLGLALCALLWRRFRAWWARGLLAICAVAYVAVPVY